MITPARNIINMLRDLGITDGLLINSIIVLASLLLIVCIVEYVIHKKKGDTCD